MGWQHIFLQATLKLLIVLDGLLLAPSTLLSLLVVIFKFLLLMQLINETLPRMNILVIDCSFPELAPYRQLKGKWAVRYIACKFSILLK